MNPNVLYVLCDPFKLCLSLNTWKYQNSLQSAVTPSSIVKKPVPKIPLPFPALSLF